MKTVFDLAKAMECREKTEWHGEFDGVAWEIQRFAGLAGFRERKHDWTFYLHICLDRIPAENNPESYWLPPRMDEKGRAHYDYYSSPLNDIDWHRGMTWYSKEAGFDGTRRVVKAGCDYQHYWDYEQGGEENVEWIKRDVVSAIQSFRALVPGYKYWCRWDGKLHAPSEVTVEDGKYRCECRDKVAPAEQGGGDGPR